MPVAATRAESYSNSEHPRSDKQLEEQLEAHDGKLLQAGRVYLISLMG